MLREVDFYIGVVLSRLIRESSDQLNIRSIPQVASSAICVDGVVALFIKHCTKRLTPWSFTFTEDQIDQIHRVRMAKLEPVIALVCHEDGIVGLTIEELVLLIGDKGQSTNTAWIKASRERREAYAVRGSSAGLGYKVSPSDFSRKVNAIVQERLAESPA
jgi:hypothetical protein